MKFRNFILLILSGIIFFSCNKNLEDWNKDPQGFTYASDGALFNGIISSLSLGWNEQFYIHNEIFYKQTQLAALTNEAWGNFTLGTEEIWENYYGTLAEVRELEQRLSLLEDSPEKTNMTAMLKVLLAYKTFRVTDLFGDIPFSEAGYGYQDLDMLYPAFDTQEDIYKFLLEDLAWVEENIIDTIPMAEPFTTFATFDNLFNGDLLQWRKLGNSLRLRQAMRMAEVDASYAGPIIRNIIEDELPVFYGYDFITPKLESACLWPALIGFSNLSLNWSFREHKNLRMGSNIWHQMSADDNMDGSSIFDPRAFIFFEGNNLNQWVSFPQNPPEDTPASGGIPYGEHRDQAGSFAIKGENCIYSPFNYFIIRDEDYMPIILMTGSEIHFIKAEAYTRGIGVDQDLAQADIEYMNGLNSSIEWWMQVAENLKLPLSGMEFPDYVTIPSNVNAASVLNVFGSWNAADEEERLIFIYTQRWLDAFRQPDQAYALTRRTGKTPREGANIEHFRLPYPPSEVEYNTSNWSEAISNQGGDTPDFKLWWIP